MGSEMCIRDSLKIDHDHISLHENISADNTFQLFLTKNQVLDPNRVDEKLILSQLESFDLMA